MTNTKLYVAAGLGAIVGLGIGSHLLIKTISKKPELLLTAKDKDYLAKEALRTSSSEL